MQHRSSADIDELAARIKALRRTIRLSQAQLAKRLGTRQSVVSRWEQGKHVPDDAFIEKMAALSGLPIAQFRYGRESAGKSGQLPRAAWGRRLTDHLHAAWNLARKSGRRDVAGTLSILLEKCRREDNATPTERDRRS